MSKATQQLITGHGATQFRAGKTAAGDDQLIAENRFFRAFHVESFAGNFDLLHFKTGQQLNIGLFQRKTQHIHHGIGLIGIRVHSSGLLRNGEKTHGTEPGKRIFHVILLHSEGRKGRIIAMIGFTRCVEVGQVAAAIAGSCQLSAHSRLPLHEDDLRIFIFCRSKCRGHAGRTGANDSDYHIVTCFLSWYYNR